MKNKEHSMKGRSGSNSRHEITGKSDNSEDSLVNTYQSDSEGTGQQHKIQDDLNNINLSTSLAELKNQEPIQLVVDLRCDPTTEKSVEQYEEQNVKLNYLMTVYKTTSCTMRRPNHWNPKLIFLQKKKQIISLGEDREYNNKTNDIQGKRGRST